MKQYKNLVRALLTLLLLAVAFGAWAQDEAMSPEPAMEAAREAPAEAAAPADVAAAEEGPTLNAGVTAWMRNSTARDPEPLIQAPVRISDPGNAVETEPLAEQPERVR